MERDRKRTGEAKPKSSRETRRRERGKRETRRRKLVEKRAEQRTRGRERGEERTLVGGDRSTRRWWSRGWRSTEERQGSRGGN